MNKRTDHAPSTEDLLQDARLKQKEEKMEEGKIVVAPIVKPAVSTEEALQAWKQYEDLKAKIVTQADVQKIQGKDFLKKSYWRKIATFFNLSLECVKEERQTSLPDVFTYLISYKASAPNGRFAYGDGACSSNEKGLEKTEHNTRSTAHTRAFNRAVSNLVGGGEVSYEEITPIDAHSAPNKATSVGNTNSKGDLTEIVTWGKKHKGKSFEEVHKENSGYFTWLLDSDMFKDNQNSELREKIELFLDDKRLEGLQ